MSIPIEFPDGAVALVTGGSRGIGRATCLSLAEAGASVVVNHRDNDLAAKRVVEELEDLGVTALAVQADMAEEADVRALFRTVRAEFGRLDVLVANAGIIDDGLATVMSTQKFDRVLSVNLRGTFLACREALRLMIDQRSGAIVTVASSPGIAGMPGQANYCASKGGVLSMSRTIADEVAGYGIRVNVVAPGTIETDMTQAASRERRDKYRQLIPMQRFADPVEVARVITFLASPLASYVTGECVKVDGGLIV